MSKFLSFRKGEVKELDETLANQLIEDGIAKESTLIEPEGTLNIIANKNNIDVAKYAKANVNVIPSGTIEITQNGETDVTNYSVANVDVKTEPVLIAQSFTGLSGFTDKNIEAITKVSGCVKIEVAASLGGQEMLVSTFTRAGTMRNGDVTSVLFSAAISSGMESAMLVLEFEEDTGDPESPIYSARLADAAATMDGSWIDVSSMLTISVVTIYSVEVEE